MSLVFSLQCPDTLCQCAGSNRFPPSCGIKRIVLFLFGLQTFLRPAWLVVTGAALVSRFAQRTKQVEIIEMKADTCDVADGDGDRAPATKEQRTCHRGSIWATTFSLLLRSLRALLIPSSQPQPS